MKTQRTARQHLLSISLRNVLLSLLVTAEPLAVHAAEVNNGQTPTEAVKGTIADLIAVLDDDALKQAERAEERRHKIEDVIRRGVDYEEMAKRALGRPWLMLSEHDRQEFVSLFVQLLRDSFAGRITEHHDEQVDYLGEQRQDLYAEVRTQLKGRKTETPIDFRLISHGTEWRVYDVVIDGASIVNNYRSQFTSIIHEVSYTGLVQKMKQKAVAVKVFENSPSQ
ncbi:MlaC/ttg2D family ABC transporter substrate-binding protein [Petrachloros mirabilis]